MTRLSVHASLNNLLNGTECTGTAFVDRRTGEVQEHRAGRATTVTRVAGRRNGVGRRRRCNGIREVRCGRGVGIFDVQTTERRARTSITDSQDRKSTRLNSSH